jgi:uncharacterized protein (DUF302 family)
MSEDGLITTLAQRSAKETMDALEAAVKAAGMRVFARIDHAAGAAETGLALRPTEVLIFGNARAGTPLMQARQTIGIDLPLKVLVWEDEEKKTWLTFNDPRFLAERHGLGAGVSGVVAAMSAGLQKLIQAAAAR